MKHKNRGKCVVFNHKTFDKQTKCKDRDGTDKDVRNIITCFERLDFEVIVVNDGSLRDIRQTLFNIGTENHTNNDCVVVIILTHGNEHTLWARDTKYKAEILFPYLYCSSLIGKPKIFIIQACRGNNVDSGSKLKTLGNGSSSVDKRPIVYKPVYTIPTNADLLIYQSTSPGHYSFRNADFGSYFIQTLVSVLNDYCYKSDHDLVTLFTIVNQRMAFDFESNSTDPRADKKKQIPCITSMLTRLVYFTPKSPKK
ncbi:unnamed protein product [Medioppia subpectinata]|uniref:Uncharacterized protein n=1 Tax=Medioppia subpectinata TaxID=1979941 RepID=A0A7R9KLF6_9ACAR|nr:unnamed protein product [Medioppia subpectinata]CAG2104448.1 unnamed protein product [Medioppia subpectinata]